MDRQAKWQFCCCSVTRGVLIIAIFEMILSSVFLLCTCLSLSKYTVSDVLILSSVSFFLFTSLLVILGVLRSKRRLLSPSLVARALLVITVQGCGIWSVLSHDARVLGAALPLVATVFALLTFALLAIYSFFLVVRAIKCIEEENKLKIRRTSYIEAAMMEEAAYSASRRTSEA